MHRALAHYPPREMAVLGVIEFTLCFVLMETMIQTMGVTISLPALVEILPRGDIALAAILTVIAGGLALTVGLYRPDVCLGSKPRLIATGLAAISAFAILIFVRGGPSSGLTGVHAIYMTGLLAVWLATIALIRLLHGATGTRGAGGRRVLLLGEKRQVDAFGARLRSGRGRQFEPVAMPNQTVSWEALRQLDIWGVVVASEPRGQAADALLDCKFRGTRIFSSAAFHETHLGRFDLDALTANDLLTSRGFAVSRVSDAVKRLLDVIVGSAMLVVLLPMMVATAIAVKIDSPGPIFYRQQRVGRFDASFVLLKFRSMTADAEASGSPRWAQKQDPRVTRVGRFIRATRIDELPQLVNILRGEMSLVGPRPERPHFVEQLSRAIPFYRQRSYVKPGLTGWAQVNFPYGASVEDAREKLAYDLYYVKNRTIMLDLRILIATVRVVLSQEGAR